MTTARAFYFSILHFPFSICCVALLPACSRVNHRDAAAMVQLARELGADVEVRGELGPAHFGTTFMADLGARLEIVGRTNTGGVTARDLLELHKELLRIIEQMTDQNQEKDPQPGAQRVHGPARRPQAWPSCHGPFHHRAMKSPDPVIPRSRATRDLAATSSELANGAESRIPGCCTTSTRTRKGLPPGCSVRPTPRQDPSSTSGAIRVSSG